MKIEGSFFVDPRIQKEVVEDLENYGFESIEIKDSSFQPMITFWGEEEEIDSWFETNKWEISE